VTAYRQQHLDQRRVAEHVRFDIDEDGARRTVATPLTQATQLTGRGDVVVVHWSLLTPRRWVVAEGGPLRLEKAPVVDTPLRTAPPSSAGAQRQRSPNATGVVVLAIGAGVTVIGALLMLNATASASLARQATTLEELERATGAGRTSQTVGVAMLTVGLVSAAIGAGVLLIGLKSASPARLSFAPTFGGGYSVLSLELP